MRPTHLLAALSCLAGCASPPQAPIDLRQAEAPPAIARQIISEGPISGRVVSDDADLVILYASEQQGGMDPCG